MFRRTFLALQPINWIQVHAHETLVASGHCINALKLPGGYPQEKHARLALNVVSVDGFQVCPLY